MKRLRRFHLLLALFAAASGAGAETPIELRPGATLRGRVLGLEPAELAGAVVRAFSYSPSAGLQDIVDSEGRYSIPNLAPGRWYVMVTHDETGREASAEITVNDGDLDLDLELATGFAVDGVLRSAGRPLSGVSVHAGSYDTGVGGARAVTDGEGRFRLTHLPAGTYHLTFMTETLPYRQEIDVPADGEVVVEIDAVRISGHVRGEDGTTPLALAQLLFERLERDPADPFPGPGRHRGPITDSQGYFSLSVRQGVWRLTAMKAGYGPAEVTVEVAAGDDPADVELSLIPTDGISFEVVHESGSVPLQVSVAVLDASGRAIIQGEAPVDEAGQVRLSTVPAGAWELRVHTPDSAVVRAPIMAPGHAGQLRLPRGGQLRIRVPELADVRTRGRGNFARVELTEPDGQPYDPLGDAGATARPWLAWNGEATIPLLAPGIWSFTITHPDGRTWAGEAMVTPGETTEVMVP